MRLPRSQQNKIQVHPFVDRHISEQFEQQYPHCRSRFIENAMKLCLSDKKLFDKIFFCDLLSN